MGGIDQIDMVSMLPSLILIKNEGFWMIWDGFELFGVELFSLVDSLLARSHLLSAIHAASLAGAI